VRVGLLTLVQEWGGCEVHAAQLTRTLRARGHDATIVCLSPVSYELYRTHCEDALPIVARPTPRPPKEMGVGQWLRFFSAERWDSGVLIKGAFGVGDWKLDLAARLAFGDYLTVEQLEAERIPRTSRRHFGVVPGLGLWWRRELLRGRLRALGPGTVICVSNAVRRRLREEFRFPDRKLVVIHNGIDTERFRPDREAGRRFRRALGIPDEAIVLGAAGRFAPMKGYDIALAGFQALLGRFPNEDLRMVLVGQGDLEADLRAQAERIGGRVIVAPFSERPWEVYNGLDVFLMPSRTEGLPLALLEAMACGTCPVAAAAGGIPEILAEPGGGLGWLVPVDREDRFTEAMGEAVSLSRSERTERGARARERVRAHFDAQAQFNACVDVIERSRSAPQSKVWHLSCRIAAGWVRPTGPAADSPN